MPKLTAFLGLTRDFLEFRLMKSTNIVTVH